MVIEHNLDVIKTADHLLDLGPGGGVRGGEVVAQGTPEEVVAVEGSYTGWVLKPMLTRQREAAAKLPRPKDPFVPEKHTTFIHAVLRNTNLMFSFKLKRSWGSVAPQKSVEAEPIAIHDDGVIP